MSNACKTSPTAKKTGNPSTLFDEIRRATGDRETAKKLWAFTQTDLFKSGFPDIALDENGEPTFEAVNEIFNLQELASSDINDANLARRLGLVDKSGRSAQFKSSASAFEAAEAFNDEAENKVGIVQKNPKGNYVVTVADKTTPNIARSHNAIKLRDLNNALIEFMRRLGYDVQWANDPTYAGVFDPLMAEQNGETLKTVIRVSNNEEGEAALPEEVSHFILAGLTGNSIKERIDRLFTPDVVKEVLGDSYDTYASLYSEGIKPSEERLRDEAEGQILAAMFKGDTSFFDKTTPARNSESLFRRLWNWAKSLFRKATEKDINDIKDKIFYEMSSVVEMQKNGSLEDYIDKDFIELSKRMYSLTNAMENTARIASAGEALLSRKLAIANKSDLSDNTRALTEAIYNIRDAIDKQEYYQACLQVMAIIGGDINSMLNEVRDSGFIYADTTDLGKIEHKASIVNRLTMYVQAYTPYLQEMKKLPKMLEKGEINLTEAEAADLARDAEAFLKNFDGVEDTMKDMRFNILKQLVTLFYGDMGEAPEWMSEIEKANWQSVDTLLHVASRDLGLLDTSFMSAGDSKNPLINVIHHIVVSLQAKRNNRIRGYSAVMMEAEDRLHKAGYSNDFIYRKDDKGVPTGYIVGPFNCEKFDQDRLEYESEIDLIEGLTYYEKSLMMKEWDDAHLKLIPLSALGITGEVERDGSPRMEYFPDPEIEGYYNPDFDADWSEEQKNYYKAYMAMKAAMESLMPEGERSLYRAPQVRKSTSQMFDNYGKDAARTLWGNWRRKFSIVDDNIDYSQDIIDDAEGSGVKHILLSFDEKTPVKRVPVYYTHMMEDMRDLSTDATRGMLNYIAMAVNYSEMGKLTQAMRLMQDHVASDEYEVVQRSGTAVLRDVFQAVGKEWGATYKKSGESTKAARAIIEYIDRQFFNDTKEQKSVRNPFNKEKDISLGALGDILLHLTSVARIGLSPISGMANVLQGESQLICEAARGSHFNYASLAFAKAKYAELLPKFVANIGSVNRDDMMTLLIEQFNSSEDYFRDVREKNFNKGAVKRVMGRGSVYFLNTGGEHYLHTVGMIAMLQNIKVKKANDSSGKKVSLYSCLEKVHDDNGWHLELSDDIEFMDKNKSYLINFGFKGDTPAIVKKGDRDKLFENLSIFINKVNDDMHGGYSEAERGNMNRKWWARAVTQFRQWMFAPYNKLYSGKYYDAVLAENRRGAHISAIAGHYEFITGVIKDMKRMSFRMAIENNRLSDAEKKNMRVAFVQTGLFVFLMLLGKALIRWKDEDDRAKRVALYSIFRLETELGAMVPYPPTFFQNIFTLIQSPAASVATLEAAAALFDFGKLTSGRFKGWSRAKKTIWVMTPLYNIQKFLDMKDYNYMFNIFKR